MALNADRVGHRYAPYRYEVSREKVLEYAAATGVGDPASTAREGDVIAPPTFAACFTVGRSGDLLADPQLGAHPALVHGSQEYVFHRPVRVGDALRCTPWIAGITARRANEFLTLQIDCVDETSGQDVVTSRMRLVFLGSADSGRAQDEGHAGHEGKER